MPDKEAFLGNLEIFRIDVFETNTPLESAIDALNSITLEDFHSNQYCYPDGLHEVIAEGEYVKEMVSKLTF